MVVVDSHVIIIPDCIRELPYSLNKTSLSSLTPIPISESDMIILKLIILNTSEVKSFV